MVIFRLAKNNAICSKILKISANIQRVSRLEGCFKLVLFWLNETYSKYLGEIKMRQIESIINLQKLSIL